MTGCTNHTLSRTKRRVLTLSSALMTFALLSPLMLPCPAEGQTYRTSLLFSGLDNPRGLTFGADGALYVAEAGRGGNGPSITQSNGMVVSYGASSAVTRFVNGTSQRIATGLPSLADAATGDSATGLHDITFGSDGNLYGVIGLAADPAQRADLGAVRANFGQLARIAIDGSNNVQYIADISAYEAANNPDGGLVDSNPYGVMALPNGAFAVADAGANALVGVDSTGNLSTLAVLPARPNPLPFGPPFYQAVPTSVAVGPDGAYYVGQLTGFPFPQGGASVFRYDPTTGQFTEAYTGFTNIIDLTFGPDNELYVLQISENGLASPTGPVPGALIKVGANGDRTTILSDGLVFPGGMAFGPDGALYVSNFGVAPFAGQVLRIEAVPEPGSVALLFAGALTFGLGFAARRRVR